MTLSTSNNHNKLKIALYNLIAAVFCAVLGGVYEIFSHGIYSYYMMYAFMFPLVLGALPFLVSGMKRISPERSDKSLVTGKWSIRFWVSGIAVMTVGSLMRGVLEIYGSTNWLLFIYPVAGIALLALGLIFNILSLRK